MNTKPYSELKKKLKYDRATITNISGFYVNEKKEIIASFDEDLSTLGEEEGTKVLNLFKKVLSGRPDRNGFYLSFPASAVRDGEPTYTLLSELRNTRLEDESLTGTLADRIKSSLDLEGDYLILMAYDTYDVISRSADALEPTEVYSSEMFRYFIVAVCPAKLPKSPLTFSVQKEKFVDISLGYTVGMPEVGFMFPAFTDGATDIYGALYYNKSRAVNHEGFCKAVFGVEPTLAPDEQKESFNRIVTETLGDECTFDTYCAIRDELNTLTAANEETGKKGDPYVSPREVGFALERSGVDAEKTKKLETRMKEEFQGQNAILASNIVELDKLIIDIEGTATIQLNKEKTALLDVKTVDGAKCVVIKLDGELTVNGVPLKK